jgi:hypothetical protein
MTDFWSIRVWRYHRSVWMAFLVIFSLFWKEIKVGLCDLHVTNFWITEPTFIKFGMYKSWHLSPSQRHTSYIPNIVCVSICASHYRCLATARYKRHHGSIYTRNNRRIAGQVVFYAIRVLPKESRRLVLPRTSCFVLSSPSTPILFFLAFFILVLSFLDLRFSQRWLWWIISSRI